MIRTPNLPIEPNYPCSDYGDLMIIINKDDDDRYKDGDYRYYVLCNGVYGSAYVDASEVVQ